MDYLLVIFLPVPSLSLPFAPASPLSHGCHLPATGRIWAGSNIAHSQNKITSEGDGNYATRHFAITIDDGRKQGRKEGRVEQTGDSPAGHQPHASVHSWADFHPRRSTAGNLRACGEKQWERNASAWQRF